MKNFVLMYCFVTLSGCGLYAQDLPSDPPHNWSGFMHLEAGFMYPDAKMKESIAIRQNISSYFVNQSSNGQISSNSSGYILGLRGEYFNDKLNTGVSAGLRYTSFSSEISGYSSSNANFFYLRYSMLNSDTKFARVKSITEANHFITIPVEIRMVPLQYKGIALFAKAGAEFSPFNLKQNTNINFQDKNMEIQQDTILNTIGLSSNTFYSTLYASLGVKFGYENKTNYIFEVFLPSFFLTKNNFTLINADNFAGFKVSLQFPLNK